MSFRLKAAAIAAAAFALPLVAAVEGTSDMATLNDLVGQIENAALRERIEEEIKRVAKQKKFGLVFEEHLPECTPLWEIPVKRGSLVAKKDGKMDDVWRVTKIEGDKALCVRDAFLATKNAKSAKDYLVLPKNKFAVLMEESAFDAFKTALSRETGIETVYLVTDYAQSYKSMARALKGRTTYQLYRDYIENFRINRGRN
jgi:hypothetical protein